MISSSGDQNICWPPEKKLSFLAPIMSCERQSRPPLRLIVLHFIAKQLPIEIRVEIKSSQQIVTIFVAILRKWFRCRCQKASPAPLCLFHRSHNFLYITLMSAVIEFTFCDTITISIGQTCVKENSTLGKSMRVNVTITLNAEFCPLECPLVVLLASISCPQIAGLSFY